MENIIINDGEKIIQLTPSILAVFALGMVWSIIWKGIALWKAARISHKKWFIALLVFNTIGILDIIYIYFIASKYSVETEEMPAETKDEKEESSEIK